MQPIIYWLEFVQLSDRSIIPIRSVNEKGINTFGSGYNYTVIDGERAAIRLKEFPSPTERSNFIKEHKNTAFEITRSVNIPSLTGIEKWNALVVSDIIYFIDSISPYKWIMEMEQKHL